MIIKKTNVMRILEQCNIDYTVINYNTLDGLIDGKSVAEKIKKPHKQVFKTLVTKALTGDIYVFVVPVCCELNLKKAAKASAQKKIEMLAVKDITKVTGYVKGGCSPMGMKKNFATFIDRMAKKNDKIVVSAGAIGYQIELAVSDLTLITEAKFADITD